MKKPKQPPEFFGLIQKAPAWEKAGMGMSSIFEAVRGYSATKDPYPHWDKLQFLTPPEALNHEQWWFGLKFERQAGYKEVPLTDKHGRPFRYLSPEPLPQRLHEIDLSIGGGIHLPDQIINPSTRDRYLVESLIEEAITSSQLEGAATTRKVAKEMIRAGRKPSNKSERMILNNFLTMKEIAPLKNEPLSPELVFKIHESITRGTLDDPSSAGRFRSKYEDVVVADASGTVFHIPPAAGELEERMARMCEFANQKNSKNFVHPALRAMMLHFWLAYDHPFVDGNGRTARARCFGMDIGFVNTYPSLR